MRWGAPKASWPKPHANMGLLVAAVSTLFMFRYVLKDRNKPAFACHHDSRHAACRTPNEYSVLLNWSTHTITGDFCTIALSNRYS